ncbi:MAG: hypothetical protein IPO92_03540 [Saprospiraceae bacterium]|nr:hypothetical protein [Saprospiraceae bacterium]
MGLMKTDWCSHSLHGVNDFVRKEGHLSTKYFLPREIAHIEELETRMPARLKELKLKTSSGRRFIRKNYLTIT